MESLQLIPREWAVYGNDIFLFAEDNKTIKFNNIRAFYDENQWSEIPKKGTKEDRSNKLLVLFKLSNIDPYNALTITGYTKNDFIEADYNNIKQTSNDTYSSESIKLFFDIEVETQSEDFPTPDDVNAKICIITMIFSHKDKTVSYLLSTKPADAWVIDDLGMEFTFLLVNDEKELLQTFYQVWEHHTPTELYHLNGYDFDIPFIINRTRKHKIKAPVLGFVDYGILTRKIKFFTRGIPRTETTWLMPGVRNIDLLSFFRRFYPEFPMHNLDYVCNKFLGQGKSGLSIEKMFQILGHGTSEEMNEVIRYACIDVIRLFELEKKLDILDTLVRTANSMRVTVEHLLMFPDYKLIKSSIYSIDHTVISNRLEISDLYNPLKPGIYHHFHLYNYRKELILGRYEGRFRTSPPGIAEKLCRSNFTTVEIELRFLEVTRRFMALEWYGGYTYINLELPLLVYDEIRFVLDSVSYSTYNSGIYEHFAKSKIRFDLIRDFMEANYEYRRNLEKAVLIPTIFETDVNKLQLTSKIRESHSYCNPNNVCYQISMLIKGHIVSWRSVKYYKTIDGYSLEPENLDLDWYREEMRKVGNTIMKLSQM